MHQERALCDAQALEDLDVKKVANGVRGPYTRSPPMVGTDGGAEATDIAYVDRHEGPSRRVWVPMRNDDSH